MGLVTPSIIITIIFFGLIVGLEFTAFSGNSGVTNNSTKLGNSGNIGGSENVDSENNGMFKGNPGNTGDSENIVLSVSDNSEYSDDDENPTHDDDDPSWFYNEHDIDSMTKHSSMVVDKLQLLEKNILDARIAPDEQFTLSNAQEQTREAAKHALIVAKTTSQVISRHCPNKDMRKKCTDHYFRKYNASSRLVPSLEKACNELSQVCPKELKISAYRTASGKCNHIHSASLGQSLRPYKRLLPPAYGDSIHSIRRSVDKAKKLPSARLLCDKLINREASNSKTANVSLAFAHWAEFVGNDLAQTVPQKMFHYDKSINCCTKDGHGLKPRFLHPSCNPILVQNDDLMYLLNKVECLSYTRSMGALQDGCKFGPVEQLNQATHYLDASHIYGNNVKHMKLLRGNGGEMAINDIKGSLPKRDHSNLSDMYCREDKNCLLSGDSRVNSHPQLAALHTLFLREHNRIVNKLRNSSKTDEECFQEARRFLIAEIQHITYEEWLPLLLPEDKMEEIKSQHYKHDVDPTVSNSFATAVISSLKSMIPQGIQLINNDGSINTTLKLADHLYKTNLIANTNLDLFIRGLTTQKAAKIDLSYAKDLIDYYPGLLDVVSLDIQRGRDHGLPSYNEYRELSGLNKAKAFLDLFNIPGETIKKLSEVYENPNDIDLIIGGLAEKSQGGGILGDTFTYIISDQFRRTRAGDRYFYSSNENFSNSNNDPWHFTVQQLKEIRSTSLATIICDNTEVDPIQPNVFLPVSMTNQLTPCRRIRKKMPGIQ